MASIEEKLKLLDITLPDITAPVATYVPFKVVDNMVYISGQLPIDNGVLKYVGKVDVDYSIEEGQAAARLCALNMLAHLKKACNGNLDRVKTCVKLGGFVNCSPGFTDQPKVINGASDLMVEVFGDTGKHARAAVGVNALPLGVAVEVEGIFLID
jgi:enamine deaminase RidA (YjgF/YER057c/UK114 family)